MNSPAGKDITGSTSLGGSSDFSVAFNTQSEGATPVKEKLYSDADGGKVGAAKSLVENIASGSINADHPEFRKYVASITDSPDLAYSADSKSDKEEAATALVNFLQNK